MLRRSLRSPIGARYIYTPFLRLPFGTIKERANQLPHNRFGVIISKNVDKRAVVRNKLRRMVLSCVEHVDLPFSGKDILVVLSKKAASISKNDLGELLIRQLQQKRV